LIVGGQFVVDTSCPIFCNTNSYRLVSINNSLDFHHISFYRLVSTCYIFLKLSSIVYYHSPNYPEKIPLKPDENKDRLVPLRNN